MAININHSLNKIVSTENDLKLDADDVNSNLNVSAKRVVNASDPVDAQDLVTKAWHEANQVEQASNLTLGTPTDGSWNDGALEDLTAATTVANAVDDLNEALLNVQNNTFVKGVDFTANPTTGGAGLSTTLTISAVGNPNRYTVNWGDGNTTTATADSTPSHTYASNVNSPFDVTVTAFNNSGSGSGSTSNKVRADYITIFTSDPNAVMELYRNSAGGSALTGDNLYVVEGDNLYLENDTTNTSGAAVTYSMNWGDASSVDAIASDAADGGVSGNRLLHTWGAGTTSGLGKDTVTLTLLTHSTALPASIPDSTTTQLKVYASAPTPPDGLSTKTLLFTTSAAGSPYLAANFTDNTPSATLTAGTSVSRVTTNAGNHSSDVFGNSPAWWDFAWDGDAGIVSAYVNGTLDGSITLSASDNSGSNGSLIIDSESDYHLYGSTGMNVGFANSISYPGLYKGFRARVSTLASGITDGVNSMQLRHSTTGNTNVVEFVKDTLTSNPQCVMGTLTENVAGTYRYISGVPYYNTGSPSVTVTGATVTNLVGQTYKNTSNPIVIEHGPAEPNTAGFVVDNLNYSYSNIDGATTMLSGGIPIADTGVGTPYTMGALTVPLQTDPVNAAGTIKIKAQNVNGFGNEPESSTIVQVYTDSIQGVNEEVIEVLGTLGSNYTDDAHRIIDFNSETTDTPSFNGSTDFMNGASTWSGAVTVEGTQEATVRFGYIKHFTTNLGTGYLPSGPNRSSATGNQYFTFAFHRVSVANFDINITSSGINGIWIAAPGTTIDNSSSLNGWIDCSEQYAGVGVPGTNTGQGGNGSNGCALTGADVIATSTALSGGYTMTLGSENMSNATGNVVLVRIALSSGQSISTLTIGEAS